MAHHIIEKRPFAIGLHYFLKRKNVMSIDNNTIQTLWDQLGGDTLFQNITLEDITQNPNYKELFASAKTPFTIVCVDDGVNTENCIALAGSGIFVQDTAAKWIQHNGFSYNAVSYHPDCGACSTYVDQNNLQEDPYTVGKKWAQELASQLGIDFIEVSENQMTRPIGFHDARGLVIDGTGRIQTHKYKGSLPPLFTCSFGAYPKEAEEYLLSEIEMILGIAFGQHGFAEKFTSNTPFHIWIIGNNENDHCTEDLILQKILPTIEKYRNRIVISSTTPNL